MRTNSFVLILLVYLASLVSSALRIGDVFDIQPGGSVDGGCASLYYRDDPNTHLNKWWSQILSMHAQAISSLATDFYEGSGRTQKLLTAMFGIQARVDSQGWSRVPDPNTIDGYRLWKVRKNFGILWDFMNTPGDANYKAKLFCEGGYWHQQFENSPVYDAFGNKIPRDPNDPSRGFRTLGEQLVLNGAGGDLDVNWYFHFSVHTEYPTPEGATVDSKYLFWPRASGKDPAARSPWPVDEKTGSTHPCMQRSVGMMIEGGFINIGVTYPEGKYAHLILYILNLDPQPVGKRLADMETNSLTLYHEMCHLALGARNSPDSVLREPRLNANGDVHPQWPWNVNAWGSTGKTAIGGNEMLRVALYDRATDDYGRFWGTSLEALESVKNPESVIWFSYANFLLNTNGDDWSQGVIMNPHISINETTLELIQHGVNITEILERWRLEEEKYATAPMTEETARML